MEFDHSKWPAKPPLPAPMTKGATKSAQKKCRHFEEPRGTHFHILSNFRYLTYAIFFWFYQSCRARSGLSFELLNTENWCCLERKNMMLRWPYNFWLWKILEKFLRKIFRNFFSRIILESVLHPLQKNWPITIKKSCSKSKITFYFYFKKDFRNRNIATRSPNYARKNGSVF